METIPDAGYFLLLSWLTLSHRFQAFHHNKVVVTIDGLAHASVIIHKVLLGHLQGVIPASNHVQRPQKACLAKR